MARKCEICNGTGYKPTIEDCPMCGQPHAVYHVCGPICEYCNGTGTAPLWYAVVYYPDGPRVISASGGDGGNKEK
jgi:hypothetical protein